MTICKCGGPVGRVKTHAKGSCRTPRQGDRHARKARAKRNRSGLVAHRVGTVGGIHKRSASSKQT